MSDPFVRMYGSIIDDPSVKTLSLLAYRIYVLSYAVKALLLSNSCGSTVCGFSLMHLL